MVSRQLISAAERRLGEELDAEPASAPSLSSAADAARVAGASRRMHALHRQLTAMMIC